MIADRLGRTYRPANPGASVPRHGSIQPSHCRFAPSSHLAARAPRSGGHRAGGASVPRVSVGGAPRFVADASDRASWAFLVTVRRDLRVRRKSRSRLVGVSLRRRIAPPRRDSAVRCGAGGGRPGSPGDRASVYRTDGSAARERGRWGRRTGRRGAGRSTERLGLPASSASSRIRTGLGVGAVASPDRGVP